MIDIYSLEIATIVFLTMLFAGFVKGVIGLGLPLIAVSILSIFLPIKVVLGILMLPLLVTNAWQVYEIGGGTSHLHRFWLVGVFMIVGLWIGTKMLISLDAAWLFLAVGSMITFFTAAGFLQPSLRLSKRHEKPVGALIGGLAGICGGLGGIWGPPISIYLLSLNLKKDEFIGTVGVIWFLGAIPLCIFYFSNSIFGMHNAWHSFFACIPAMVGFHVGKRIREYINQEGFRKLLMISLFLMGLNLIRRAWTLQ